MPPKLAILLEENIELKSAIQEKTATIESQEIEIDRLQMEIRLLKQTLFAPKSERIALADPNVQARLFNEAEATSKEDRPVEEIEIASHHRKKGGRRPLPENLPRIEQVHDIPEEQKVCGHGLNNAL